MAILDQFGRPIETAPAAPPSDTAVMASVRDRWSGYPSSGLTPGRLTGILRAADQGDCAAQAELFEEIEEKDSLISGHLATRKLAVSGLDFIIRAPEGTEDDPAMKRSVDFCREVFKDIPKWKNTLKVLLNALGHGYSIAGIRWRQSAGQVVIDGFEPVHPKRLVWRQEDVTPRILVGNTGTEYLDPPPFSCVFHTFEARSGFTPRLGLLRTLAWLYLFKNYALKDWATFIETYALPLRLGKYPNGATDAEKKALLNALASLGTDATAIISAATEIEFPDVNKGRTNDPFKPFLEWLNQAITFTILGQLATSQSVSTGLGSSVGDAQAAVRGDLRDDDAASLCQTVTAQIIRPLVGFNYGWNAPVPEYAPPPPAEDLAAAAALHKILIVDIGLPVSEEYLREKFGIPGIAAGETPLKPPKPTIPSIAPGALPPGGAGRPPGIAAMAAADPIAGADPPAPGQNEIDAMVTKLGADAKPLNPMLAPVRDLIQSAASYQDILKELYGLYPKMDSSAAEKLMSEAMFAARAIGRGEAAKQGGKP